jgi:hypothetical protein
MKPRTRRFASLNTSVHFPGETPRRFYGFQQLALQIGSGRVSALRQTRKETQTMKLTTLTLTFAAVAMLAAAGTASAETLKAEIPFSFQAAGTRMHAGAYSVKLSSAGSGYLVQITNQDEGRSIITLPQSVNAPWTAKSADVVLSFACTNGNCELSSLRNYDGAVYSFATGKKSPETRIATVVLRQDRAE